MWIVIAICAAMMLAEIVGGYWFGSVALIADGLHMSTHAGALLIAALAYTFARRHADHDRPKGFGKRLSLPPARPPASSSTRSPASPTSCATPASWRPCAAPAMPGRCIARCGRVSGAFARLRQT
jgi:hypothetical protein